MTFPLVMLASLAQAQDQRVHTVGSIRYAGGREVSVAVVTGNETQIRIQARSPGQSVGFLVSAADVKDWADSTQLMVAKRLYPQRGDSLKTYGPSLNFEDGASFQVARLDTPAGIRFLIHAMDADNEVAMMATREEVRSLLSALRNAIKWASSKN